MLDKMDLSEDDLLISGAEDPPTAVVPDSATMEVDEEGGSAEGFDSVHQESPVEIMPTNEDLKLIMTPAKGEVAEVESLGSNSSYRSTTSNLPGKHELQEQYLGSLADSLRNLITWGPGRLDMGELQALAGLIRECRKAWSSIVDADELEHWGQLVMDVMKFASGDPGMEWDRSVLWERFLRQRGAAESVARVLGYRASGTLPTIRRFPALTREMLEPRHPMPTNWKQVLDGRASFPRYRNAPRFPPKRAANVRSSTSGSASKRPTTSTNCHPAVQRSNPAPPGFENTRPSPKPVTVEPVVRQSPLRSNSSDLDPSAKIKTQLADLKTKHDETVAEIDRSLKELNSRRAKCFMDFNNNKQRLETDLKTAQEERKRWQEERANRAGLSFPPLLHPSLCKKRRA